MNRRKSLSKAGIHPNPRNLQMCNKMIYRKPIIDYCVSNDFMSFLQLDVDSSYYRYVV